MKKVISLLLICFLSISLTGCFKRDSMDGITIYTTLYPTEYVTEYLYGEYSNVNSIYPNGINPREYELTTKQISDYSRAALFVFNGITEEKELVTPFFKKNNSIKIIDATSSMEFEYTKEELWLNPANLLMLAQNVKTGLHEYINNGYLRSHIDMRYDELKLEISNLDAKFKLMAKSAGNPTLLVSNNMFMFLEKYGFKVLSVESGNIKDLNSAKALIDADVVDYILVPSDVPLSEALNAFVEDNDLKIVEINTLNNLTSEQRRNREDYLSIMNDNMELIRNEIY